MRNEKLTYVTITQDRVENLQRNFPKVVDYVDRILVIDGGSVDGTVDFCKSFSKVELYHREWDDSFANQYNEYLKHVREGWIALFDDDEVTSPELCQNLDKLINESNYGANYSIVEFRAHPFSEDLDQGPCNYWRQMLFRWTPNLRYQIDLHQQIVGYQSSRCIRTDLEYYHVKTLKSEYRAACRNWWTGGVWPSGPRTDGIKGQEWHELRKLTSIYHPEVVNFNHLARHMIQQTLHPALKKWIVYNFNKLENEPLFNELRAYKRYYYELLNPGESPIEVDMNKTLMEQI
jgi:glycosyltransferase involved in cell wall biosynthesis